MVDCVPPLELFVAADAKRNEMSLYGKSSNMW
jgi:hypothetical protein